MRFVVALAIALSLPAAGASAQPRTPVKVGYDAEHLDLEGRTMSFRPSRPVVRASIVALGEDGRQLGTGAATYERTPADGWWSIGWTQPAASRVMILKLRVEAVDGTASNLELIPWSVAIDHEDVRFATDSAAIEAGERAKLDASLRAIEATAERVAPFMKVTLYVAGHTDTVGAASKNRKLSQDRARAIGAYFRAQGLRLPIAVAGFGEDVLKAKTPDETAAPANRRADYVLGPSAGAPPFKGAYLKAKASWKALR
jgi:outer membrane protein OmpA-like peptidoglycan-associated protein